MSRASEYANAVSNLYARIGEARANEAANKGRIWGEAIANIGDFVGQYPERKARMEEIKNRAEETKLRREQMERQAEKEKRERDIDQSLSDLFDQVRDEYSAGQNQTGFPPTPIAMDGPGTGGIAGNLPQSPSIASQVLRRSSPFPTPAEILRASRGNPTRAVPIINAITALQKLNPGDDPETKAKQAERVYRGFLNLPPNKQTEYYPSIKKILEETGHLPPGLLPEQWDASTQAFLAGMGQKETPDRNPTEASLAADLSSPDPAVRERAKVALDRLRPIKTEGEGITGPEADERYRNIVAKPAKARNADDAAWAAAYERQKTLGPMAIPVVLPGPQGYGALDRRTMTTTPITEAATGDRAVPPPTQAQAGDVGYAKRLQDAEQVFARVESDIAKMNWLDFKAQEKLPAAAQSEKFQPYDQASRNLINTILRRESGAAISQSEFDNARRQYLPQPGDTPEMLALKAQNRKRQLEALVQGAGPAYKPDTERVRVKGPNGERGTVPKGTALPPGWSLQ